MAKSQPTTAPAFDPGFRIVGYIDSPRIPESSGLVISRRFPGVYWTQNDSDNPAAVFAITREGKTIAEFPIKGTNVDWEDIALDEQGRLYMADIGDNNCNRREIQVYRVPEPDPHGPIHVLVPDQIWRLTYPAKAFDAESLFLIGDYGYIISKHLDLTPAGLYRFSLAPTREVKQLERIATLPIRFPATAADVSRDGKWLAVMTLCGPYVFQIDGDPLRAVQAQPWYTPFVDPHIEGVCFVLGGLLATTEGRRVIFFPFNPQSFPTSMPNH